MAKSTQQNNSSSVSAFLATLIPVGLVAIVYVAIFLYCRPRQKRIYRPRTYLETLDDGEKSSELPPARFGWFKVWRSLPDEYVLNHQSLDGYLYLRFLKMLSAICFGGACITWPILFPVNATAGGGMQQFDLLSFANVPKTSKNRYYAHVFVGWAFFSFVMWIITRETIYFINIRQAYLMSPFNAAKISSRTVLFTDVPAEYQNKEKLLALFGTSMRRFWLATDCKDLRDKVEERDKDAMKLETAEIKLVKLANDRRIKWEKKNDARKDPQASDAEAAQAGSQFMKEKDRPKHKLGKIPCIGRKVDTINWERSELKRLIPEVEADQMKHRKYETTLIPAVFVEFNTQHAAETAFRRMSPKKSPNMNPRAIAARPSEIIWKNLKIKKGERLARLTGKRTFLTLMIIFWAIPVAIVGAISNIDGLEEKVPFLKFINHIPKPILGVVTGLLPSILLAVLMALVPIVCRLMAKLGGEVTLPNVELSCQTWYMAFQVIQVFLITTFASGATKVVAQIINEPSSATGLLAQNLPRASNFYIPYLILQGLGIASGLVLNIGGLVVFTVLAKFLDKSPRKMYKRYITLSGLGWGTLYPQFGNLGIIALSYSIIAPLILGFAAVAFFLVYLAVRYNSFYVLTNNVDTHGRAYARGLQQLMTGVYISEVCLIGLFGINAAAGPIVLMVVFLVFTAIYHATMRRALLPLMNHLPDSYEAQPNSVSLFNRADYRSYDYSKAAGVSPVDSTAPAPSKLSSLFERLFDTRKHSSHSAVRKFVPETAPPSYEDIDADNAYYDPAVTSPIPRIWIVKDQMGISARECQETNEILPCTDQYSRFNEKGKVEWDREARLMDMPIWEKRIEY